MYLGEVTNSGRSQDSVVKSANVPRLHRSAGIRTEHLWHSGSGEHKCAGQPLRSPEVSPTRVILAAFLLFSLLRPLPLATSLQNATRSTGRKAPLQQGSPAGGTSCALGLARRQEPISQRNAYRILFRQHHFLHSNLPSIGAVTKLPIRYPRLRALLSLKTWFTKGGARPGPWCRPLPREASLLPTFLPVSEPSGGPVCSGCVWSEGLQSLPDSVRETVGPQLRERQGRAEGLQGAFPEPVLALAILWPGEAFHMALSKPEGRKWGNKHIRLILLFFI